VSRRPERSAPLAPGSLFRASPLSRLFEEMESSFFRDPLFNPRAATNELEGFMSLDIAEVRGMIGCIWPYGVEIGWRTHSFVIRCSTPAL
jgi:hypothetical protein